jgi:hypothetical protein
MDAPLFIDEYHAATHLDNVNSCAHYCGVLNPADSHAKSRPIRYGVAKCEAYAANRAVQVSRDFTAM